MISSGELEIVTTSLQSFLLHGTLGIAALGVSLTVYRGISSFLFGRWSLTRSRVAIREMKENEEWVLITGASSGLGREFASRFANLGLPIILVARRKDLLEEAASNIERRFGVDTLVIEADLSTSQGALDLVEATKGRKIGVLVNNAGAGLAGDFVDQDLDKLIRITELNCVAPLILFRSFLSDMAQRNRGFVINVSSVSAYLPLPSHAVYAASKAYLSFLSLAVNEELKHRKDASNVRVITCEPGTVDDTGFQNAANQAAHSGHKTSEIVADCVDSLLRGKRETVFGTYVWIRSVIASILPRSLGLYLAWKKMSKYS